MDGKVTDVAVFEFTNTYKDPTPPPDTGDHSNMELWVTTLSLSSLAFCTILYMRRKKEEEEQA